MFLRTLFASLLPKDLLEIFLKPYFVYFYWFKVCGVFFYLFIWQQKLSFTNHAINNLCPAINASKNCQLSNIAITWKSDSYFFDFALSCSIISPIRCEVNQIGQTWVWVQLPGSVMISFLSNACLFSWCNKIDFLFQVKRSPRGQPLGHSKSWLILVCFF